MLLNNNSRRRHRSNCRQQCCLLLSKISIFAIHTMILVALLSPAVTTYAFYKSAIIMRRPRSRSANSVRSIIRSPPPFSAVTVAIVSSTGRLYMGGYYYIEDKEQKDDDDDGNKPAAKKHMIYGTRCVERKESFSINNNNQEKEEERAIIVTGLQAIKVNNNDNNDDNNSKENNNNNNLVALKDYKFISILLDQLPLQEEQYMLRVLEVGADPIFSIALSRLIALTKTVNISNLSITIRHSDEKRLLLLEHAYQYFGNTDEPPSSSSLVEKCYNTELLIDDISSNKNKVSSLLPSSWTVAATNTDQFEEDDVVTISNKKVSRSSGGDGDSIINWIVFTSTELLLSFLDEALTLKHITSMVVDSNDRKHNNMNNNKFRIFVPSCVMISAAAIEQRQRQQQQHSLFDRYNYELLPCYIRNDDDSSSSNKSIREDNTLYEILCSK